MDVRASDDDENTVTIYEQIGESFWGGGFTARKLSAILRSIGKKKDVVVSINSPGGDVFEGVTIYNILAEHEGNVTIKIPGLAASAAAVIAMAGDTIKIAESGFIMIHNAWGCLCGNRHDMREAADIFEKFDSAIAGVFVARTGKELKEVNKLLDAETWMSGAEALDLGFADEILSNKSVKKDEDAEKLARALARRQIESALSLKGFSRKEREEILKNAGGVCDTASGAARDAGYSEEQIMNLLNTITGG